MTCKNIAAFDPDFEEALSNLLKMMRSKLDGSHSTNEHDFSYASLPDSFFLWNGGGRFIQVEYRSLNLKRDYENNMPVAVTVFRWLHWLVSSPLCATEACYGASGFRASSWCSVSNRVFRLQLPNPPVSLPLGGYIGYTAIKCIG